MAVHSHLGDDLETNPDKTETLLAVNRTIADFAMAEWEIPDDFLSYDHFERVLMNLEWDSSPGYPYLLQFSTNREMFQVKYGLPSAERKMMVWQLVTNRLMNLDSDPIRLFVKPEPHKQTKILQHRYRLISSVSVIDQIIDHLLFGPMNQAMVDNYMHIPSKVGWSPYVGGWKIVPAGRMVATDKTAWDWTVREWLVTAEFAVRRGLCRTVGPTRDQWEMLAAWRYKELYKKPLFVTSGGDLLRQKAPGVVKSGCVNTITTNSIMQVIVHNLACLGIGEEPRAIWAMGDDTLQYPQENMERYLKELGRYCILKEYQRKTEFAGNEFLPGSVVEPIYFGKHAFNLLHVDPDLKQDIAFAYSLLYHRSSRKKEIVNVLAELGILPLEEALDMIFDGE